MTGIYIIKNKLKTNRFYIGSSKNFKKRVISHKSELNNNKHHCKRLQKDWNKHKEDDFEFILFEECENERKIIREQFWIDLLDPWYNSNPTAGGGRYGKWTDLEKIASRNGSLSKEVFQFTLHGDFLNQFPSVSEAARSIGLKSTAHIADCCNGKRRYANGFLWSYQKEIRVPEKLRFKIIHQYDLDGSFIKEWNGFTEIGEYFNLNKTTVMHIIKKQNKTRSNLKNYKWKIII